MKNLLLLAISLPLLLGGCGEKGKVKPEEPVVKIVPELEDVNLDELDEQGEFPNYTYFITGSDTLYTGKAYRLHPNGQKERETNFKDGKKDGLEVWWYDNGQKLQEENYKDGKEDGLSMSWYDNGQKHLEALYKDGWPDGLQVGWHENGQKAYEEIYMNGEEVEGSAKFWNSKGESVDTIEEAEAE